MGEVIDLNKYRQEKQNKGKKNVIDFPSRTAEKDNIVSPISQKKENNNILNNFENKKFLKDWEDLIRNNEKFFISLDQVKKEEYLPHLESLNGKSRGELLKIIKEGLKENGHKPYLRAVAEKLAKEYVKEKIKDYSDIVNKLKKMNFEKEILEKEKEKLKTKEYLDLWSDLENNLFFLKETGFSALPLCELLAIIEILKEEKWI